MPALLPHIQTPPQTWPAPGAWTRELGGFAVGSLVTLTACAALLLLRHQPAYDHVIKAVSQMSAHPQGSGDGGSLARSNAIHQALAQLHANQLDEGAPRGSGGLMLQGCWELFGPTFPCMERERFGDILDGGKWICSGYEIMSQRPCWVFSLGSHGQSDFEEAIRAQYPHCNIHIYDPTISIEVAQAVEARTQGTVHRKWIVPQEGFEGRNPANYTTVKLEMEQLGASWLSILKVDIEGSEWLMFDDYIKTNTTIPASELLVELHVPELPEHWGVQVKHKLRYFFDGLARLGFRVTNNEVNFRCRKPECFNYIEYTFVQTDDAGHVRLTQQ